MKILKRLLLGLLAVIGLLALAIWVNPQFAPNHDTPYLALQSELAAPSPAEGELLQRLILYGDAGHAATEPWQASLARIAERASISPEKTVVVALGDNIYMRGYPRKEPGQAEWDEDQLESIGFLDSQLKVARASGANMFLVPGNHDWYATEVDGQAQHVADYAARHGATVAFRPHRQGHPPLPESADFDGVSLVFVDSEWLIQNDPDVTGPAYRKLDEEMSRIRRDRPGNLIVLAQHHPVETMGQHGGYLTHFGYWFFIRVIDLLFDMNQDIGHPDYDAYVARVNAVMKKYDRVIHAAGHEHSLQLFRQDARRGADYNLVSGAGNSNKVSGVWHNENSRFALSKEGFMELAITGQGVHLSVYDAHRDAAVAAFWLELDGSAAGAAP